MSRFGPDVHVVSQGDRVSLYHAHTGRHISLSRERLVEVESWDSNLLPPPSLRALASRLEGLYMLQESPQPELGRLLPIRSRLVLLLPRDSLLWHPVPTQQVGGRTAYSELALTPIEMKVWRSFNGSRSVEEVARHTACSTDQVLEFLLRLTHLSVQAIQLRSEPIRPNDASLRRLVMAPPSSLRLVQSPHPTLAQAFSQPHPGLKGASYGARLYGALEARGLLQDEGDTLIISKGDTLLTETWLNCGSVQGHPQGDLIHLDIHPQPTPARADALTGVRRIEASITAIPLSPRSLSLVICNEIMADLRAVPFDATTTANPTLSQGLAPAVAHAIEHYGLEHLPGRAWYNLGAWQVVEQMAKVLRPGGVAVLCDYGELDQSPLETTQRDHFEVSIHFGHLVQIAEALGLEARAIPLSELLDVHLQSTWLSQHSYEGLQERLRAEGQALEARAWTPADLTLPWPVEGLHWVSLSEEGPAPLVTRYQALILRKP